jgi:hypothetical protein
MRFTPVLVLLFVATASQGADDAIKASAVLDGKKVQFPAKGVAEGVKATIGLLESCSSEGVYDAAELKKAEDGDHVRLVFAKPITVRPVNEKVEFSELVFRLPINTGVFWLRSGDKVRRFTKFQYSKEKPFQDWLREAQAAD